MNKLFAMVGTSDHLLRIRLAERGVRGDAVVKIAWDFFLSLVFRAIFTAALFGGVCFFIWAFDSWRTGFWKGEPEKASLSFVLAAITTLVGAIGAFRRGNAEQNFSLIEAAGAVTGVAAGHVHVHIGGYRGRTLRRFPSIESYILGGFLIALWPALALLREDVWPLRVAAMVGAVQVLWGVAIAKLTGVSNRKHSREKQTPRDDFEME